MITFILGIIGGIIGVFSKELGLPVYTSHDGKIHFFNLAVIILIIFVINTIVLFIFRP